MSKLSKQDRQDRLKELVEDPAKYTQEEIVEKLVEESGVTEKTILGDITELFPDGFPDVTVTEDDEDPDSTSTDEDPKTGELSTPVGNPNIEVPEKRVAYVPELMLGRVDPAEYKPKKGEEGAVHVEVEATNFNQVSGKKKSRPEIIKVNVNAWPTFKAGARKRGYTHLVVLHAPEGVDTSIPAKADN